MVYLRRLVTRNLSRHTKSLFIINKCDTPKELKKKNKMKGHFDVCSTVIEYTVSVVISNLITDVIFFTV